MVTVHVLNVLLNQNKSVPIHLIFKNHFCPIRVIILKKFYYVFSKGCKTAYLNLAVSPDLIRPCGLSYGVSAGGT